MGFLWDNFLCPFFNLSNFSQAYFRNENFCSKICFFLQLWIESFPKYPYGKLQKIKNKKLHICTKAIIHFYILRFGFSPVSSQYYFDKRSIQVQSESLKC
uniref:Uncharacterized protein n=1 Tax=Cacopsylla melanoneura TaxID=428564 RepID=A0A8D8SDY3_9HEMI